MLSVRQAALDAVKVGDVIFGIAAGGQEKLLLVYRADENSIFARHVTSQTLVEFGRNGKSRRVPDGGSCEIISVAPLSSEDHQTALGLDRKMRTAKKYPDAVLSEAEIKLILTKSDFYRAHPLPSD